MDKFTKFVLSVIAVCLVAIAIKLWEPTPAYSGFMDKGPTVGDLLNLRKLKGDTYKKERKRIIQNILLAKVYGTVDVDVRNTVDVNVENTVDVSGSIDCY